MAQVCQRWQQSIYASPHCLDLQIFCTDGSSVRKDLSIWPTIPIALRYCFYGCRHVFKDKDNILAALKHPDGVCCVKLVINGSQLGKIATVMQESFLMLMHLLMIPLLHHSRDIVTKWSLGLLLYSYD